MTCFPANLRMRSKVLNSHTYPVLVAPQFVTMFLLVLVKVPLALEQTMSASHPSHIVPIANHTIAQKDFGCSVSESGRPSARVRSWRRARHCSSDAG